MTERDNSELQDWFARSRELPSAQPFAAEVLEALCRRERRRVWLRRTAQTTLIASLLLLLPELSGPVEGLAVLPLTLLSSGAQLWPLLVLLLLCLLPLVRRHFRRTLAG